MESTREMSDPIRSLIVSQQILWLRRDTETTPMHVIKLVYLCHGWTLGLKDEPLITEPVEAWRYGPVVSSTYHTYKAFSGGPITVVPQDRADSISSSQTRFIEDVLEAYESYSPLQLSNITHQPGTPWYDTYETWGEGCIIPNELIRDFYRRRAKG